MHFGVYYPLITSTIKHYKEYIVRALVNNVLLECNVAFILT